MAERPSSLDHLLGRSIVIEWDDEPITEAYLEIVDMASGDRVVSAIELLSPTNKLAGDGNEMYMRKQREYRIARVNQIEIDLTRAGDRSLVFPLNRIPAAHRATYLACVRRGNAPSKIEVYPMPLDQPLPVLSVPLTAEWQDVPLNLQSAVDACYRNGRYEDIDYSQALRPALSRKRTQRGVKSDCKSPSRSLRSAFLRR